MLLICLFSIGIKFFFWLLRVSVFICLFVFEGIFFSKLVVCICFMFLFINGWDWLVMFVSLVIFVVLYWFSVYNIGNYVGFICNL